MRVVGERIFWVVNFTVMAVLSLMALAAVAYAAGSMLVPRGDGEFGQGRDTAKFGPSVEADAVPLRSAVRPVTSRWPGQRSDSSTSWRPILRAKFMLDSKLP